MTKDTFGESLKREREMRGVTLEEISAATRIATRFLRAIENEQWDQLPGGVFNRGFVRAVARYLGLDEESIVAEYTLAVGDRPSVPVWTGSPPAVAPNSPGSPGSSLPLSSLHCSRGLVWHASVPGAARRKAGGAGSGISAASSLPSHGRAQQIPRRSRTGEQWHAVPGCAGQLSGAPAAATDSAPDHWADLDSNGPVGTEDRDG